MISGSNLIRAFGTFLIQKCVNMDIVELRVSHRIQMDHLLRPFTFSAFWTPLGPFGQK